MRLDNGDNAVKTHINDIMFILLLLLMIIIMLRLMMMMMMMMMMMIMHAMTMINMVLVE